ncbi:sensor histidine kinase [Micromonospora sp. NBC_00617]|uniref:sensor histidine kinase n=1 Tax=Micromonospora sp. NBC_00617 TaxID=2903587 RepID=UPI0030E4175A
MRNQIAERGRRGLVAAGRGLVLFGLSLQAVLLTVLLTVAVGTVLFPGVFLVPATVMAIRKLADHSRRLADTWSGVEIPVPYRPRPPIAAGAKGWWQRWAWLLTDPATWRDLLWLLLAPIVGASVAVLPAAVLAFGLFGLAQPIVWRPIVDAGGNNWYAMIHVTGPVTAWSAAALGAAIVLLGLAIGPRSLLTHARFTRWLLAPTALALRVRRLTETRTDALESQAAELRRIERDLHDGAQARLVAMGMTLSAAEQLLDHDLQTARALVGEARTASTKALNELRDLVRGIHPPVLADRGLPDAVRAVALDSSQKVAVSAELPGRLAPAVESAAYFAISEVLANAAKHSGAERVSIDIRHRDGMLRVTVADNGRGGAEIGRGTGLRGIQRRLAAFDGTLTLNSPPGGPTTVTMELPCELSSPKTTLSCATD